MDSLLDIAESVKFTDPFRAGLIATCHESGVCSTVVEVTRGGTDAIWLQIKHGAVAYEVTGVSDVGELLRWLDKEHSSFEAVG